MSVSSHDQLPPLVIDALRIEPALAKRIRVVALDVDGVLTDGGIYLGAVSADESMPPQRPLELKRYDIQDGVGLHMLRAAGIEVVIVTGRVSHSVTMRARELGVTHVVQDPHSRKLAAVRQIVSALDCTLHDVAFVGDDLPDLSVMRHVALPVAVANAAPEVRRIARLTLQARGGHGAVREFAEALLHARGEWHDLVERYVASRGDALPEPVPEDAGATSVPTSNGATGADVATT